MMWARTPISAIKDEPKHPVHST